MHQVDTLSKHDNVTVVLPEKLTDSLLQMIGKPSFQPTFSQFKETNILLPALWDTQLRMYTTDGPYGYLTSSDY